MLKKVNLLERPWYVQLALFSAAGLLLYFGFYYFVTKGTREETSSINEQVAQLQQANARAQAASQRLNDLRASYARVQADSQELLTLLPEHRELTSVLQGLQERARGSLSVQRFSPHDDFQQDFYSGKPIQVEVSGTYNNLGNFFAQMAAYQRIVSISDFHIQQTPDQGQGRTVDGQFLLTAYYVSSDTLENKKAAGATPANSAAGTSAPAK